MVCGDDQDFKLIVPLLAVLRVVTSPIVSELLLERECNVAQVPQLHMHSLMRRGGWAHHGMREGNKRRMCVAPGVFR